MIKKPKYFKFYKSHRLCKNLFEFNTEYLTALPIQKYLRHQGLSYATVEVNKEVEIPVIGKRYIDFVITWSDTVVWVEYNGYQHIGLVNDAEKYPEDVEALKKGLKTNSRLEAQKYRDEKVKEYAKNNNISLIVYQTPSNDKHRTDEFNDDYLSYRSVKFDLKNAFYTPCYIYNNTRTNYA